MPDFDDIASRVIYEQGPHLVVNKPAGIATSGRDLDDPDCLQAKVIAYVGRHVWACHQLDKDTSGVCIFAKKKGQVEKWHARMRPPVGRKLYLAIVEGKANFERRRVRAPLKWNAEHTHIVTARDGKAAASGLRVVTTSATHSIIEVTLETGRTHQARVHLAHIGHPVVGDSRYGNADATLNRHALHAWALSCTDDKEPRALVAPWPDDLRAWATAHGLGDVGTPAI